MDILNRMLEIMKEKNIKNADLAEFLGINRSVVSTWKSRSTNPPIEYTVRICELLDISFEFYLTGKNNTFELTDDEKKLINNYRQCTPERKSNIQIMTKDAAEASQKYNDLAITIEEKSSTYKTG